MLTIAEIISVAKISSYLASRDIARGGVYAQRIKKDLPLLITMERKSLEWAYDQDEDYEDIKAVANYVYNLCAPYNLEAQRLLGQYSGSSVNQSSAISGLYFPIMVTSESSYWTDGTNYVRPALVGINYILRSKEFDNGFIQAGEGFSYLEGGGFEITLGGFDVTAQTHNILIERVYS